MELSVAQPAEESERNRIRRWLNAVAAVAILDAVLLVPLLYSASFLADHHEVVRVLGPVHGFFFMVMVGLVVKGVGERWWGWWFPGIVVVTLGPPGSLIGDWIVRRRLRVPKVAPVQAGAEAPGAGTEEQVEVDAP